MIKKSLKAPTFCDKEIEISPIIDYSAFLFDSVASGDKLKKHLSVKHEYSLDLGENSIKKTFFDDQNLYLYLSNGFIDVYNREKIVFSYFYGLDLDIRFFSGNFRGEKCVFAVDNYGGAISISKDFAMAKLHVGENYIYFNGKIFCSKENVIKICDSFDNETPIYDQIKLNENEKIIAIKKLLDGIFVFTENGVYSIKGRISLEEIRLEKLLISTQFPFKNSFAVLDDKIIFACVNGLYSFDGKRIEKLNTLLSNLEISSVESAFAKGDRYIINFKAEETDLTFMIEGQDIQSFIDDNGAKLVNYDKFIDIKTASIFAISHSHEKKFLWISKDIDLATKKAKIFYSLSLESDYNAKLSLIGDFGRVTYSIRQGYNELMFNLVSSIIRLEISADKRKGEIGKIKIFYREQN